MEIAIVLGLLLVGLILFTRETFSVDVVTLLLLLGLIVSKILTPAEAFAGFSSDILIVLASIFVIGGALQETGILEILGSGMARIAGKNPRRLLLSVMALPAALSGFMNNTTVTAMFVPPVVGLARRVGISPSRLLLPLAFASILGGTCTLIGTSTNVAVSGYIQKAGMPPLGFFEITPIGLIIVAIGIAYLWLVGSRMLPETETDELTDHYDLRQYLTEIVVLPRSPLVGQLPIESDLGLLDFRVLRLLRGADSHEAQSAPSIEPGDTLIVEGPAKNLLKILAIEGLKLGAERSLRDVQTKDSRLAEAVVNPRSDLVGQNLRESEFRQRFGALVLAINRRGQSLRDTLGTIRLQEGDVLLLQGPAGQIEALRHEPHLSILGELAPTLADHRLGIFALCTFLVAIAASALGWLAVPTAFLAAALAMVLSRCITIEKAYTIIDWRLLILIGGMTAFGTAMQKSGAAAFLAGGIVNALSPLGILAVLAGFFVLTIALTQPMSNAAAALVVLPIALEAAHAIGANERTFAIAIMLAASVSFITPFEPSCVLVYGPGRYRFFDFVRIGGLLTILLTFVVVLLIPFFWPLRAIAP